MSDPWLKTAKTQIDPWLKAATKEEEPKTIYATPVPPEELSGPEFATTPRDIRPRETGLWSDLETIGEAVKIFQDPTTPEGRKLASENIYDRLKWAVTYYASLGGRLGPKGLKKELREETEEFGGFGPALMPVAGETGTLAIEWGWLYPKLFKLVGVAGSQISRIPKVGKGIRALKSLGGIAKTAEKHPHLYSAGTKALTAFMKGEVVGQTMAAVESLGKDKSIEEWIVDMNKRGALLGGVATVFSVANSIDQHRYITATARHLRLNAYNRYVERVNKGMLPKHSADMARREGRKIDDVIYYLEQEMLGAPRGLYGAKKPGLSPEEAAKALAKHGYVLGESGKTARQLSTIIKPRKSTDVLLRPEPVTKGNVYTAPKNTYREAYNPNTGQRHIIPEGMKVILPKGYEISEPISLKPTPAVELLPPIKTAEQFAIFEQELARSTPEQIAQQIPDDAFEAEIAEMDAELREIQRPTEVVEKPPEPPPVAIVPEKPTVAPTPAEPTVEKPVEPELTKKELRQREIEAETEEAGISPRRRNRLLKETAKRIAESDIYQVALEGIESQEIGPGYYFVSEKFRSEVEDIIGKRKGGLTRLQKMFTFDPHAKIIVDTPEGKREIGPLPWDTAVQQALGRGKEGIDETAGEMDISDFVQQVKDSVEAEEEIGGLNKQALDRAAASGDPYLQYLMTKQDMLRDGKTVREIDEMTREWAEEYGLDESAIENEFLGPEPLKIKEIRALPEAERDAAVEALARENVLRQERQEAKQAVNDVLKANDIEVEVEEVAEITEEEEVPFERRGKPVGAAIITPAGREIVQLAYGADSETGYHEGYHILRAHLTPKDVKVLEKHYKGNTEAEAREFAEFAKTGKAKVGYLRGIWRKLIEKLRKIKSALQGRGYRTANDIFGEIQRGVVPKEAAAPGAVQFERGVFGQPIEEQLRLPFKERQAAIRKVAVQEAREKIAKRKAKPAKKLWTSEHAENAERGYYRTHTGKTIENPASIPDGKDLELSDLLALDPETLISAKQYSGRRGGVSRKNMKVKNIVLPERKPYEEWRPKGVVPIKTKLIKAVDAEIQRTMKPKSNSVTITPEEIDRKLGGLFGGADLFYDPSNSLAEVTEAFNQLVKGGPLIQFETQGDQWVRESMRSARIKAEKERLKAVVKPKKKKAPGLRRKKVKVREPGVPYWQAKVSPEGEVEFVKGPPGATPEQKTRVNDLAIAKGMISERGKLTPRYRKFAKVVTGKTNIDQMTQDEVEDLADMLDLLTVDNRGIARIPSPMDTINKEVLTELKAKLPELKTIGFLERFRESKRVFQKMGLHKEVFEPAFEAEISSMEELFDFRKQAKEMQKFVGKDKITAERLFNALENPGSVKLSEKEKEVVGWAKTFFDDWADRLELGPEARRKNYITHIFEADIAEQLKEKHPIDPDLIRALDFITPQTIFNPFLQKRLGKTTGLKRDLWAAMQAYEFRAIKKFYYEPLIKRIRVYEKFLPPSSARYLRNYITRITGRPLVIDREINQTLKEAGEQIAKLPGGKKLAQYLTKGNASGMLAYNIAGIYYEAWLGLRPASAIKNLSQHGLALAEAGPVAFARAMKTIGKKRVDLLAHSRVLRSRKSGYLPGIDQTFIKSLENKRRKIEMFMFRAADRKNVSDAFLAGYFEAKAKGLSDEWAFKRGDEVAAKTQYLYSKLAGSQFTQSAPGRILGVLTTWPRNWAELMNDWVWGKPSEVYQDYEKETGKKITPTNWVTRRKSLWTYLGLVGTAKLIEKTTPIKAMYYTGWTSIKSIKDIASGKLPGLELPATIALIVAGLLLGDKKLLKQAWNRIKRFWVIQKEIRDVISGKKDWLNLFIYLEKKKDEEGWSEATE